MPLWGQLIHPDFIFHWSEATTRRRQKARDSQHAQNIRPIEGGANHSIQAMFMTLMVHRAQADVKGRFAMLHHYLLRDARRATPIVNP